MFVYQEALVGISRSEAIARWCLSHFLMVHAFLSGEDFNISTSMLQKRTSLVCSSSTSFVFLLPPGLHSLLVVLVLMMNKSSSKKGCFIKIEFPPAGQEGKCIYPLVFSATDHHIYKVLPFSTSCSSSRVVLLDSLLVVVITTSFSK